MSKLFDYYAMLKSTNSDASNVLYLFKSGIFFICIDEDAKKGEYKLKCVKSKEILIMHTFFVQERRKNEYKKNKC